MTLDGKQTRQTIFTIAGLPIFSKAYYASRPVRFVLARPAARLRRLQGRQQVGAGRFIEYERVADYWGADLPVNVGTGNFDVIRIDFFQEREAAFEAFQEGPDHLSRGVHLAHLGDRLRLFPR